jgi:hypothetical protein
MRVVAAAYLLPLLLAACAGSPVEPAAPGPAAAIPAGVVGTYRLQTINDQIPPILTGAWQGCREQIVSAGLALYPDRRYTLSGTARQDCTGAPPIENRGGGTRGRYAVEGDIVRFDAESERLEGVAGPGWIENPPDRRLTIEDLGGGGIGMLAGDTLTIRLENGGIATFRKVQD